MLRKFIDRLTPDPETLSQHRSLRLFQRWLKNPNLWHFNRYSVSSAVFIGFFVCFIPLPVHMAAATLISIWWSANVPTALAAVWLSNPVTIPVQFYFAYKVGTRLLHQPEYDFAFELSLRWVRNELDAIWQPLLLGCLVCGLTAGALGWIGVRIAWRIRVTLRWRARQQRRTLP